MFFIWGLAYTWRKNYQRIYRNNESDNLVADKYCQDLHRQAVAELCKAQAQLGLHAETTTNQNCIRRDENCYKTSLADSQLLKVVFPGGRL